MRTKREILIEEFGYYDKNYEDKGGKNDRDYCPRCKRLVETFFRCAYCGAYFETPDKYEYWDQTDPRYTDQALKQFANDAVKYLLEDEYQRANIIDKDFNSIILDYENVKIDNNEIGFGDWGKTELDYEYNPIKGGMVAKSNIHIPLRTLRNKKQCFQSPAHEAAHTSPEVWELIMKSLKSAQRHTGHHLTFQRVYQRYKTKLKSNSKFKDYYHP